MTDRIDHVAEAAGRLRAVASVVEEVGDRQVVPDVLSVWNANVSRELKAAQVHATLALVEQQRIANLISLAKLAGRDEDVHEEVAAAAYGALNALVSYQDVPNGHMGPDEVVVLRPEIAAALGIKAVDHD